MGKVIRNYFKFKPNRDDILARIYSFLTAISENNPEEAKNYVLCDSPIVNLIKVLNEYLYYYAMMNFEDDEILTVNGNYINMLDKPSLMKEEDIFPIFSGKKFDLETGELISVRVGIKGFITNIRIYFVLEEYDAVYYLRVKYINKVEDY